MINMDGVSRGNYRFSASGVDLNRKWKQPLEQFHP
jgi:murein tripeptide amidase MpaA